MPNAPLHPCANAGCPTLVPRGVSRCVVHAKPAWTSTHGQKRIGGHLLQRLRMELYAKQEGRCAGCGHVCIPEIMVRDHIVPLAEGTVDQPNNDGCQMLCVDCSQKKTQA